MRGFCQPFSRAAAFGGYLAVDDFLGELGIVALQARRCVLGGARRRSDRKRAMCHISLFLGMPRPGPSARRGGRYLLSQQCPYARRKILVGAAQGG